MIPNTFFFNFLKVKGVPQVNYNALKLSAHDLQWGSNLKYAMFYDPFIYFHKLSWLICRIFTLTTLKNPWQEKSSISLHRYWIKTHTHFSLLEYTQYWLRPRSAHFTELPQLNPSPFNITALNTVKPVEMHVNFCQLGRRSRTNASLLYFSIIFLDIHKFKSHTHQLVVSWFSDVWKSLN